MMQTAYSANEIGFYLNLAAYGAGMPYGIGEELKHAALFFAAYGHDSTRLAATCVADFSQGKTSLHLDKTDSEDAIHFTATEQMLGASAIAAGLSAADMLASAQAPTKIVIANIDQPALAAACLLHNYQSHDCQILWGQNQIIRKGDTLYSTENFMMPAESFGDMVIYCKENQRAESKPPLQPMEQAQEALFQEGIVLDEDAMQIIFDFFYKSLVPETEQSRVQGAGASLTDND